MTEQELKELITPEFLSTLKTILDHIYKYPNKVGIDWDEVDFLPGVMEDFVTGDCYEDDDPCPDCGTQMEVEILTDPPTPETMTADSGV
jgi:hypothetical protein